MYRTRQISSYAETGSVLIVSLVMLLLLSLIGVAGIQTTIMQDRMAANLLDKGLAFEAAEAALREGEATLVAAVPPAFTGANGLYEIGDAALPDWPEKPKDNGSSVITYTGSLANVPVKPKYVIEQSNIVPAGCDLSTYCEPVHYRITSVGFGGSDTSPVVLKTMFKAK